MIGSQQSVSEKHRLGEILIERKAVTEEQLGEALHLQKTEPGYLGEQLIRLGYVDEQDIVVALVVQCNLPYIAIQNYEIDSEIISLIPKDIAQQFYVIPLDRVDNNLSVVMADPLNEDLKKDLRIRTECRIAPLIATKSEIINAIERWYKTA